MSRQLVCLYIFLAGHFYIIGKSVGIPYYIKSPAGQNSSYIKYSVRILKKYRFNTLNLVDAIDYKVYYESIITAIVRTI